MTSGLGALGRGSRRALVGGALSHLFGAATSGALVGAVLAGASTLFPQVVRVGLLVILVWVAWIKRDALAPLGLPKQVPRWDRTRLPRPVVYGAWGALLGTGLATVIPHSGYLILLGVEINATVPQAAAAGALCGLTRGFVAILPLMLSTPYRQPEHAVRLYAVLSRHARQYNRWFALIGGVAAVVAVLLVTVFT